MKTTFGRYDTYKVTEIAWQKHSPSHWIGKRVKEISVTISKGTTPSTESFTDIGVRFIKAENIRNTKVVSIHPTFFISEEANSALGRSKLRIKDLLVVIAGATIGKIGVVNEDLLPANINQAVCFVRFRKHFNVDFLYYLFASNYFSKYKWYSIVQSAQPNLSMGDLGDFILFMPPLPEQKAISEYLDIKTVQIDRKIDLLTQKATQYGKLKQSLINETVTRGLDKTVAMKDSGVEWIGEVPEYWEVKRIKEISEINKRTLTEKTPLNYEFNYVDIGSVTYGIKGFATERMTFDIAPSRAKRIVKKGDTIISTVRTYLKAIASIDDDVSDLIVSTGFAVISPNKKFFNKFYSYLLTSHLIVNEICALSTGVSYPATNSSVMGNLFGLVPPYEEQKAIANYLDTKTAQIERIFETLHTQIAKLKELRKTLINDVVTGKIKVALEGETQHE
jgi:type I restriction enzyme S subunit